MSWREWVRGVEIEPSLYAADFARLGEQIFELLDAGARVFHFDVGDGHFVPPVTIGPIVLESIGPLLHEAGGVLDCHLMVSEPAKHVGQIAAAGGDSVTFHVEASGDVRRTAELAREAGLGVGLAFNPETSVEAAAAVSDGVDLVLCMSIHPGYSGQDFLPESLERLSTLRSLLPDDVLVQVDGGIGEGNVSAVREAGAQLIVAGSSIFHARDLSAAYGALADAAG
jgi:ribulose-phosphate 3-epimerase